MCPEGVGGGSRQGYVGTWRLLTRRRTTRAVRLALCSVAYAAGEALTPVAQTIGWFVALADAADAGALGERQRPRANSSARAATDDDDATAAAARAGGRGRAPLLLEFVQRAGETLYLPFGHAHAVLNLTLGELSVLACFGRAACCLTSYRCLALFPILSEC